MSAFNIFLFVGALLMFLCMWFASQFYKKIPIWKVLISAALLTAIGLLGAHLMSVIESGNWSGRSFFGAVFLAPVLMRPVAMVLRIPYKTIMDLCAPAECIMLALLKVKCNIDGCCYGRMFNVAGGSYRFPSQIVECVAAILLMTVLLLMIKSRKQEGKIYLWYLIIYGVSRFILNMFRETTPWIGPLAAGAFWSLAAIVIGIAVMLMVQKYDGRKGLSR